MQKYKLRASARVSSLREMPAGKNFKRLVRQQQHRRLLRHTSAVRPPQPSESVILRRLYTFSTGSAPNTSASDSNQTGVIGHSSSWAARSKHHYSCLHFSSPPWPFIYPDCVSIWPRASGTGPMVRRPGCRPSKSPPGSPSIGRPSPSSYLSTST